MLMTKTSLRKHQPHVFEGSLLTKAGEDRETKTGNFYIDYDRNWTEPPWGMSICKGKQGLALSFLVEYLFRQCAVSFLPGYSCLENSECKGWFTDSG